MNSERAVADVSRSGQRAARLRGKDLHSAVAYALLHMGDVCALADSPAAELPFVIQYWPREPVLFREGVGLATALELIARSLLDRLPPANGGKVMFMRATLQGVALDHESVASIARKHGRSREHWARTYWQQTVALVANELVTRSRSTRMSA